MTSLPLSDVECQVYTLDSPKPFAIQNLVKSVDLTPLVMSADRLKRWLGAHTNDLIFIFALPKNDNQISSQVMACHLAPQFAQYFQRQV